ncbi:AraC family transcriptional regulator [Epilithonimonas hungarica]|uniref:Transcriptional regulator, AraC family n=1 Tax=Epilithonimonas hungarica TaxID=454006 RepID=A0A1G7SCF4_9FLAO|nr:helix-turn-helix domain-containing protein [Epilithonimonas hungarica]SDG20661.1 transcriptional regulator, AraC family [Epilithonimonas hungarica]
MSRLKSIKSVPNYLEGKIISEPVHDYIRIKTFEEIESFQVAHIPHFHELLYQFCYITEGSYTIEIESNKYLLAKNTILLLKPGVIHASFEHSKDLQGYIIHFSHDFFSLYASVNNFFKDFMMKDYSVFFLTEQLMDEDAQFFRMIFKEMTNDYKSPEYMKNELLKSFLNILLLKMYESYEIVQHSQSNSAATLFMKFLNLLDIHIRKWNKVSQYAKVLNISTDYLNKIAKQEGNRKAGEIIRDKLVLEAQRELIYTDKNISEIAYQFNFTDTSHFWKVFKKNAGLSPKEYREKFK